MTKVHCNDTSHLRKPQKPDKPHKDFPLFAHANGQWAKKVRGKIHFFGIWADPQKAIDRWISEKDELLAGRVPRTRTNGRHLHDTPTLRDLVNKFLTTKQRALDAGELSPRTWESYDAICNELITAFGRDRLLTDILPEDFESLRAKWADRWGVVRLGAEIGRATSLFVYAYKNGVIARPMLFGEGFKRPSRKMLRLARAEKGPKMFEAKELRDILKQATQPMKSMILLGVNCGFGNADVARLPLRAVDFETGWINYPRPKTGIARRCPLWRETIKALKEWLAARPTAKDEAASNLFVTARGNVWDKGTENRAITHEMRKLLDKLSIIGNRGFYALRHTFETIAGESRDQVAVDAIMGHDDGSMASVYRERISDERLVAVAEFVRIWLSKTR